MTIVDLRYSWIFLLLCFAVPLPSRLADTATFVPAIFFYSVRLLSINFVFEWYTYHIDWTQLKLPFAQTWGKRRRYVETNDKTGRTSMQLECSTWVERSSRSQNLHGARPNSSMSVPTNIQQHWFVFSDSRVVRVVECVPVGFTHKN